MHPPNFHLRNGELISLEDSLAVIDAIDRWCQSTGTNYNKLVVVAGIWGSTRYKVKVKGCRLTVRGAAKLRKAMADNPDGISAERYRTIKKPWGRMALPERTVEKIEPVRIIRDSCPRCGAVRLNYVCGCLSAKQATGRRVG